MRGSLSRWACIGTNRVADSCYLVGLVSDTHGLMRPEDLDALQGSDLIIHAGDIGDPTVLEALRTMALGTCLPSCRRSAGATRDCSGA